MDFSIREYSKEIARQIKQLLLDAGDAEVGRIAVLQFCDDILGIEDLDATVIRNRDAGVYKVIKEENN